MFCESTIDAMQSLINITKTVQQIYKKKLERQEMRILMHGNIQLVLEMHWKHIMD